MTELTPALQNLRAKLDTAEGLRLTGQFSELAKCLSDLTDDCHHAWELANKLAERKRRETRRTA